jgi:hypothetical protein
VRVNATADLDEKYLEEVRLYAKFRRPNTGKKEGVTILLSTAT